MSEIIKISEYQVVDSWFSLKLKRKCSQDCLKLLFADHGLKILDFQSEVFKTVRRRYVRILDQLLLNKKNSYISKYRGLDPDKVFFSSDEFPELCTKETR